MKFSFILILFLILCTETRSNASQLDDTATNLYREGNYKEAHDAWYGLVKIGNTDPNLYFNIGSAESLLGHVPESILAFEKAARLRPGDQQIKDAIKKERAKMAWKTPKIVEVPVGMEINMYACAARK